MKRRTRYPTANAKRKPSPLRLDPSRTATLRRAFTAELARRFARLRLDVYDLVVTRDAFGLGGPRPVANYDPNQPRDDRGRFGSGVASAVATAKVLAGRTKEAATAVVDAVPGGKWLRGKAAAFNAALVARYGRRNTALIMASAQAISWGATGVGAAVGTPVYVPSLVAMAPGAALAELHYQYRKHFGGVVPKLAANEDYGDDLGYDQVVDIARQLVASLSQEYERHLETITLNGWVTLETGQHVFLGGDGKVYPHGPPKESSRKVELGYDAGDGKRSDVPSADTAKHIVAAHDAALARFKELGISTNGVDSLKVVTAEEHRAGAHATGTGITHKHNDATEKEFEKIYREVAKDRAAGDVPTYAFASLEDRMIHEIGHNLGRNLPPADHKEWEAIYQRNHGNLDHMPSAYAQENSSELWAESVLAVVKGYRFGGTARHYGPSNPEVESFVRSRLGLSPRKPTTNAPWAAPTDAAKVKAFGEWLRAQAKGRLRSASDEELWRNYARQGFERGAARAFDDTRRSKAVQALDREAMAAYQGSRAEFLRSAFGSPVSVEKVQLLAQRSFDELANVTEDMATRMTRTLADGLVQGQSPHEVARTLAADVDVSRARAETVARTEVIRAHSEGQLTALEQLGVEEVGVMVEWTATDDGRLCPRCAAMEGVVLKLSEARGRIPLHPNCRCAFVPANVGEDRDGQKRTKGQIDKAAAAADLDDLEISIGRPEAVVGNALLRDYERFLRNGWVTLETGQHVYIGAGGTLHPSGPPKGGDAKRGPGTPAVGGKAGGGSGPDKPKGADDPRTPPPAPAKPPPGRAEVSGAFDRLDRAAGGYNFVSVRALREAVGGPADHFDRELVEGIRRGEYWTHVADSSSPADRAGGIKFGQEVHTYVSKHVRNSEATGGDPVANRLEYVDPPWLLNQFCATGPGGGVDPTCGKGDGGAIDQTALRAEAGLKKPKTPPPGIPAGSTRAEYQAKEQDYADVQVTRVANAVGGIEEERIDEKGQANKKAMDVRVLGKKGEPDHDLEVKTVVTSGKGNKTLSIHDDALLRKVESQARTGNRFSTVAIDARGDFAPGTHGAEEAFSGHRVYYKRGSGRYSLKQMHPVKDEAELKRLIHAKDEDLPEKARGSLPPPPPLAELGQKAAATKEATYLRNKKRKEANKEKLQAQAKARREKAKAAKALQGGT